MTLLELDNLIAGLKQVGKYDPRMTLEQALSVMKQHVVSNQSN